MWSYLMSPYYVKIVFLICSKKNNSTRPIRFWTEKECSYTLADSFELQTRAIEVAPFFL